MKVAQGVDFLFPSQDLDLVPGNTESSLKKKKKKSCTRRSQDLAEDTDKG